MAHPAVSKFSFKSAPNKGSEHPAGVSSGPDAVAGEGGSGAGAGSMPSDGSAAGSAAPTGLPANRMQAAAKRTIGSSGDPGTPASVRRSDGTRAPRRHK